MNRNTFLLAAACTISGFTAPAQAQGVYTADSRGLHAGQLDVPLNKSQVVTVDRPYRVR